MYSQALAAVAMCLPTARQEEALAKAVAAEAGALVCDEQQRRVAVLVLHAGEGRVRRFVRGVERAELDKLVIAGDDQLADGIMRVVPVYQRGVVVVGPEGEALDDLGRRPDRGAHTGQCGRVQCGRVDETLRGGRVACRHDAR